ncbi:hypothetical protein [Paenibacillus ihbetae]|nr:hypothetical protein [Paenibacillus ihbetae]
MDPVITDDEADIHASEEIESKGVKVLIAGNDTPNTDTTAQMNLDRTKKE